METTSENKITEKTLQGQTSEDNNKSDVVNGLKMSGQSINHNKFVSNKKYFTISIYALFVIAVGAFVIYLIINMKQTQGMLSHFINTLSPFLIAFFIAFLLNPLVNKINNFLAEKLKIKSKGLRVFISIFLSYLFVIGLVIVTILYVTPQLIQSITDLIVILQQKYGDIYKFFTDLDKQYPDLDLEAINQYVENLIPEIISRATGILSDMLPKLYFISVSLIKLLVNILLSIVISCYMLLDKKGLKFNAKRLIYALLAKEKADNLLQTGNECNLIFSKFIIGKSIDSLIIGILCFIVMSLLRLPYSLLISIVVGLTNMIPYFGPFIGAVPGIVIYLLISPIQCLFFIIMILVLQQFDGLYLGPKILGESTGLKPLWVIFAITIGGAYAGVLGMFLGVPIIAVITHLLNKFIERRLKQKDITIIKK